MKKLYLWNRYHIHFRYCSLRKRVVYIFLTILYSETFGNTKKSYVHFSCHAMYINHSKTRMLQIVKNGTWISENNYMLLSLCSCWLRCNSRYNTYRKITYLWMLWTKLLKMEGYCGIYSKCDVELRIPDKGFISKFQELKQL
jgi:hypothetical protein